METKEILERSHIVNDDKARRVLNTAPGTIPNIDLATLESGVSIETLEALNVPVYKYTTQITIHGLFPNLSDNIRVHGYKSLISNENKTLGVKYAAIDGDKKYTLRKCASMAAYKPGNQRRTPWAIIQDSTGTAAQHIFRDKAQAIECYSTTPDNLYIGSKYACRTLYGGYGVVIELGAVYQDNLWALAKELTGIESQAELDQITAQREAQIKKEQEDFTAKWEAEAIQRREAEAKKRAPVIAALNQRFPFVKIATEPGKYIHYSGLGNLRVVEIWETSAGKLYWGGEDCTGKDQPEVNHHKGKPLPKGKGVKEAWIICKAATKEDPKETTAPGLSYNRDWTWIKFDSKPAPATLQALKDKGGRFSGKRSAWYFTRHVEATELAGII